MGVIEIELPFPPSVNDYYRHVRGMTLVSARGRKFQTLVRERVLSLPGFLPEREGADPPGILTGKLSVVAELYPNNAIRRDIDNPIKALLDSLTRARLWLDDSQVWHLSVYKRPPLPRELAPFCAVRVSAFEE